MTEQLLPGLAASPGMAAGCAVVLDAPTPGEQTVPLTDRPAAALLATDALRAAADEGARSTVPLQARKGRASYLGERSIGHQDPGATSTALIMRALVRAVSRDD